MKCKTARATGAYSSSDWEKASKYTDNTALNTFINGTYADNLSDLVNQIDGKIESWFQTSDPATAWTTNTIKAKHVGDMWFNSSTNTLKRYSSEYQWVEIHDQTAIDAYNTASTAKDTADGKRRVFVVQPYPPYDVGDLWVNGTDLRRCATAKASGGSYNVNDWVIAVSYDNTKTVIDGGLVTSGTIQVAGSNASILAGMTGQGTAAASIRFWAGASFENRATAPFRVRQDGKVIMTDAEVSGKVVANSGSIGGFDIGQGRIGINGTGDDYNGLSIYEDCILIRDNSMETKVYAGVGNTIPASTGVKWSMKRTMVMVASLCLQSICFPTMPFLMAWICGIGHWPLSDWAMLFQSARHAYMRPVTSGKHSRIFLNNNSRLPTHSCSHPSGHHTFRCICHPQTSWGLN